MTEMPLSRNEEIQQIHKDYPSTYRIVTSIFFILLGVLLGPTILNTTEGYNTNIYTEIISIAVTVLILDYLQERRDNRNRIKDLQEQLVRDAGSPVNDIARNAIHNLRKRGWLGGDYSFELMKSAVPTDSVLVGKNLGLANLKRVNLGFANLSWSNFFHTNLSEINAPSSIWNGATMHGANLSGANISTSEMRGTLLMGASLRRSFLGWTDFTGACFDNAGLIGASFYGAQLKDALISASSTYDETTQLPDMTYWTPERSFAEFGAEVREIAARDSDDSNEEIIIYTFTDGVTRRWQRGTGWLDDRDGNPLP